MNSKLHRRYYHDNGDDQNSQIHNQFLCFLYKRSLAIELIKFFFQYDKIE